MTKPATVPEPPYYAAIFPNQRTDADDEGYAEMAERMFKLGSEQPGFLGLDTARGPDGFGITVSYWESEEAIAAWKANAAHQEAQRLGAARWYENFTLHVAKVERVVRFEK